MRTNTKRSGRHNKHRDISATERSTSNPVLLSRERKPKQAMCRSKLEDNRPNDLLQYAYKTYTLTAIVFRPPQNRRRTADNPRPAPAVKTFPSMPAFLPDTPTRRANRSRCGRRCSCLFCLRRWHNRAGTSALDIFPSPFFFLPLTCYTRNTTPAKHNRYWFLHWQAIKISSRNPFFYP